MLETIKRDLLASAPGIRAEIDRLQRLLAIIEEYEETGDNDGEVIIGEVPAAARRAPVTPRPRTGNTGNITSDEFVGLSTSQAVKRYLEIVGRGNPKGPRDMAQALVKGGRDTDEEKAYANVASVLKKLKKSGELRQVRRGEWGLGSWYGPAKPPSRVKGNGDLNHDADEEE